MLILKYLVGSVFVLIIVKLLNKYSSMTERNKASRGWTAFIALFSWASVFSLFVITGFYYLIVLADRISNACKNSNFWSKKF